MTTLDVNGLCYRSPKLVDVYDFARLIDWLEHVHDFSQVVIATDCQGNYLKLLVPVSGLEPPTY